MRNCVRASGRRARAGPEVKREGLERSFGGFAKKEGVVALRVWWFSCVFWIVLCV